MTASLRLWLKPLAALLILGGLVYILPDRPLDPWGLLNAKKVVTLIFALTLLQGFGVALSHLPGVKMGAILTGLLGGLISSTATTATLARQSATKSSNSDDTTSMEVLIFLAATAAMLVEGVSILLVGATAAPLSVLAIFAGPLAATIVLIVLESRRMNGSGAKPANTEFRIVPILSLTAFIVAILAASKLLQISFGESGLSTLTFLVSLFEIHGSLIANIQLFEAGEFGFKTLGTLLAISVAASYVSKIFLIYTLGSQRLARRTLKLTLLIFLALIASSSTLYFAN